MDEYVEAREDIIYVFPYGAPAHLAGLQQYARHINRAMPVVPFRFSQPQEHSLDIPL